jgi:hypothetical protein
MIAAAGWWLGLFLASVTGDGPSPVPWCRTQQAWEARARPGEGALSGGCPLQGPCDDPAVRDTHLIDESTPIKTLRVHLVVFREDDGSNPAATAQEVAQEMARLNDEFAPYRFAFVHTWEFVDCSFYRHGPLSENNAMKAAHAVDPLHTCNVFVKSNPYNFGTFPWDPVALTALGGIVMDDVFFANGRSILTHEFGHTLGLWHTDHGVEEVLECSACWEEPGPPGSDTTGDFCADTPPTPQNVLCADPGGNDQCSGVPWGQTLPQDYMSQAYNIPCWNMFTDQQAARMRCWTEAVLGSWLVAPCPGDADGDGAVGIVDFLGLLGAWGTADPLYDLAPPPGDGIVGIQDFLALLASWGPCPVGEAGGAGTGDCGACWAVQPTPGCGNPACEDVVCALMPSCCASAWSVSCALLAQDLCCQPDCPK